MVKKELPDVASVHENMNRMELLEEVLGMVNDVLEAKEINLYFSIVPSQLKSTTVTWHED